MSQWSRQQFCEESEQLVDALHKQEEKKEDIIASGDNNFFLNRWSLENCNSDYGAGETIYYLVHPPVQRHEVEIIKDLDPTCRENSRDCDDEDMMTTMIDDNVLVDDPEILVFPTNSSIANNNRNEGQDKTIETITTEWYFSIVYSDVWKVPVLYFTVQNMNANGSPCERSEVLQILKQYSHYNRVGSDDDSWDFLSHDEHPISGIPSFFLHPCQTMNRMQILLTNTTSTLTSAPSSTTNTDTENTKVSPPLVETLPLDDKNFLVSWMTLIFPSVGFSVPSKLYQKLE